MNARIDIPQTSSHNSTVDSRMSRTAVVIGATSGILATLLVGPRLQPNDTPSRAERADIVCTGDQQVAATPGNTLSGLIETHTETDPSERLKSAGNLALLASGVAYGPEPNGNWYVVPGESIKDMGLTAGELVTIPEECHEVGD